MASRKKGTKKRRAKQMNIYEAIGSVQLELALKYRQKADTPKVGRGREG